MEIFVDHTGDFVEIFRPVSEEIREYFAELNISLPCNFHTEINLDAAQWLTEIAGCLEKGYVMTIDYGYTSPELYSPSRKQGTLTCYHKHTAHDHLYQNIGEQDITAHVNFSALNHWGLKNNLQTCGLTDQCHFLLGLGFEDYFSAIRMKAGQDNYSYFRKYALLKHTLLIDMGNKFKVLIQSKGVNKSRLSGLEYGQGINLPGMMPERKQEHG
jgi:SAM-dependent MidA family methyltransferase